MAPVTAANSDDFSKGGKGRLPHIISLAAVFLLGAASSALWHYFGQRNESPKVAEPAVLSDSTMAVLGRLQAPVEIRFYSLLDPESLPQTWSVLAERVRQLLGEYERAANGKVKVVRYGSETDANAQAAADDGIQAFNREKGNVCYFGLALALDGRKETLPQLSPAWGIALEADISRSIEKLSNSRPTANKPGPVAPVDPVAEETLKRTFPNLASITLEEGKQRLRESALNEFRQVAKEIEPTLKAAEQRLKDALNSQSVTDQQAARQELQKLQTAHAEKLKEIAARSQAAIDALTQLKQSAP